MTDPRFIHLRVHSDFSMVDGLNKVGSLIKRTTAFEMPALAITDQANLCGLVRFYSSALGAGVKPIVGADFWVQSEEFGKEQFRLTLLAADNTGYKNLTLLISRAYLRGHVKGRAILDKSWLTEHAQGLIVISGARQGDVGMALLKGNQSLAESCAAFYKSHFPNSYFIELIRTGRTEEETYLHLAVDLAARLQLPVVASNEVCFLKEEDFEAHEVRVAIHDGYTIEDPKRPKEYSPQQYLRSEEEMCKLFADIPEALQNTVEIAKRCNVSLRLGEYSLPNFPTGDLSTEDFLVLKSREGLQDRLEFLFPDEADRNAKRGEYDERLDIELQVINQMGFPGYFLIVMEFIQWSKDHGIPVGPGRGSGAGSLVAYALKITDLDPLEFDLLFERFLNPERVSMPDFDVDFCMDRRDEVIEHTAEMYGRDAVSQIITFGTMAAKAAIRDVGRVLGQPYGFVDRLSKLVPPDPGMTLAKAFEVEPRLPELYDQDEEVREVINMARALEGVTRNAGKHAGGVVISPTTITDFAPLYCDDEGRNPVTQFDKNDVESAGLVKFDFLGLRTLTIIQWALDMINPRLKEEGKDPVDITAIPLDDKASIELLLDAKTTAVFQLESRGMKDLIRRLRPDCFEDMIALVALFRPGPLQSGMVDNFIDRKHGREDISYPDVKWQHESLKPILEPTYGIILYQEQVMQIAQVLSGYTLGGADMLRRAMGKKKPEEMAKQRATFEDGAVKNGVDGELAMKIFDLVEKFAGYGFNKSHSAAYALVSYQTLWLKTHYTAEFMAAVMSADMDNTDKIVGLVDECRNLALVINPPDVNSGCYRFSVNEAGEIVYGIGAIKGVGEGPIEAIMEARSDGGEFTDLFDFCIRVDLKRANRRILERLIKAGALDKLGPHRASMMASLEEAIRSATQHHKATELGQNDMFGLLTTEPDEVAQAFADVSAWPDEIWLEGEKETLGLYLTGHPIDRYLAELKHYTSGRIAGIQPTERDKPASVAGLILGVRIRVNKQNRTWAMVSIDDKSGRMDIMVYAREYERFADMLEKDKVLLFKGQVRSDDFSGGYSMSASEVIDVAQAREQYLSSLSLKVKRQDVDEPFLQQLQDSLETASGGLVPVQIRYKTPTASARLQLGIQWRVTPTDTLLSALRRVVGESGLEMNFK